MAYTPLSRFLARIILAERANLVLITFVQEHVTVRAKILILRYSWPADRKKSHGCLLDQTLLTYTGVGLAYTEHLMRPAAEVRSQAPHRTPAHHSGRSGRPRRRVVVLAFRGNLR